MPPSQQSTTRTKSANVKESKGQKAGEEKDVRELPYKFISPQTWPNDIFADGVMGAAIGREVVKFEFYRSVGFDPEEKKEIRVVAHRLVLPRSALPELVKVLQGYSEIIQQAEQKMAERSEAETKN